MKFIIGNQHVDCQFKEGRELISRNGRSYRTATIRFRSTLGASVPRTDFVTDAAETPTRWEVCDVTYHYRELERVETHIWTLREAAEEDDLVIV